MSKIHILPEEIISKIAAGEVVERPASVLKELTENAIDAGASSIEVELKEAGKTMIRIKDNGSGITKDDMSSLFSRHATSKISSLDELYNIMSLGFRGEALYSISAISDITLRGKTKNEECGWERHLRGNKNISQKPITMHTGTEIEVKELFFNTPARRKFLKSNTSELNALLDVFIPYTLLYPRISFRMFHEERRLIELAAADNLIQRIAQALRLEPKNILEGRRDYQGLSIQLVLGDINIQRTRKDMQFIFINKRPVQNKTIGFHLNDIYRQIYSRGIYPFFSIYITMPPGDLDVNVHPAKREVKIKNESELISLLRGLGEELLMTKSKAKQYTPALTMPQASIYRPAEYSREQTPASANQQGLFNFEPSVPGETSSLSKKLQQGRYIGGLLRKYLLFESPDSLLVIDQHAAAERINFEKLKGEIENGKVEIQQLLSPILVRLSHQEILAWEENKEIIEKAGFACTLFDKETLAIHAHPNLITQAENSLRNLLAGESLPKLKPEALARLACKSSVTFGQNITPQAAEYQREKLLRCQAPFTCPHGRPTVIELSDDSLMRQFLRPSRP